MRELLQVVACLDDEAAAVDDPLQGVRIVPIIPACASIAHLSATVNSDNFSEEHGTFRLKVDEASPEYLHHLSWRGIAKTAGTSDVVEAAFHTGKAMYWKAVDPELA